MRFTPLLTGLLFLTHSPLTFSAGQANETQIRIVQRAGNPAVSRCLPPPRGFGDRVNDTSRHGCEEPLMAVRRTQPSLHVFGHVHYDGGAWHDSGVCFSNVTTWESCRGASVFDVHTDGKAVACATIPARRVI